MAERIADIERGRSAVRSESWAEAYRELSAVDPSELTPSDLDGLADAAWWLSRTDESIVLRQRSYSGYAAAGADPSAAWCAGRLCIEHFLRGEPAVAVGWLKRAQRHLRDQPECVEHGFLAMVEATVARFAGGLDEAKALAERAIQIGQSFGNIDLIAMAIHTQGLVLIAEGRVSEGVALLDEAMTSVVSGELTAYFTGAVYCNVLEACLALGDVRRAGEWSEAARAWCDSLPAGSPYPGLCRIYRAEVASLRGEWTLAEAEATRASKELMSFSPIAAAEAFYETGEIRRRVGDFAGAEEAFAHARELGLEPQPGLALLRLARGKADAALTALRLAIAAHSGSPMRRARLLVAQIDAALEVADLDTAVRASDELEGIAGDLATPALDAAAATARGALRLAEGDVPGALERLRHACDIWHELKLPYEGARARMLYGVALRSAGDEEDAVLELRAAQSAFERLGAAPDATRTAELLSDRAGLPGGLTAREAEVLRLVAAGKTNREIAAELVISEHTVARHLQNMFAKVGVSSRSGATAFAFEHGLA